MAFTFATGVVDSAVFMIFGFRTIIVTADGKEHHAGNEYANLTNNYLFMMLPLQGWIFGMKYLQGAMKSSLAIKPCLSLKAIDWTMLSVGGLYSIV